MNTGPNVGIRCIVARNANMEIPKQEYRAGIEGNGSKSGRTMNQVATGKSPKKSKGAKGLGPIAM